MRADAHAIWRAALRAADPCAAIRSSLCVRDNVLRIAGTAHRYAFAPSEEGGHFERVVVIGGGKASAHMAAALVELLPQPLALSGHVVTKHGHLDAATARTLSAAGIACSEAGHPIPDEAGVVATGEMLELVKREGGASTLVVACISGGGSALLTAPAGELTLCDVQAATDVLLSCGAPIGELNTMRKHLDRAKGGQLARHVHSTGATLLTLVLSDVVGDDLCVIASGPTVPDNASSTFAACNAIIARRCGVARLPRRIIQHMQRGARGEFAETPKLAADTGDGAVVLCGTNALATCAAAAHAEQLGYAARVLSTTLEGEARDVARNTIVAAARQLIETQTPLDARQKPVCLIYGGETTVTLPAGVAHGQGGRNQELALAAAIAIDARDGMLRDDMDIVILAAGTDGGDGPCDAAGALVDTRTAACGRAASLDANDFLARHDSYGFFTGLDAAAAAAAAAAQAKKFDDPIGGAAAQEAYDEVGRSHVKTGPTGTNVMDVTLLLVRPLKIECSEILQK